MISSPLFSTTQVFFLALFYIFFSPSHSFITLLPPFLLQHPIFNSVFRSCCLLSPASWRIWRRETFFFLFLQAHRECHVGQNCAGNPPEILSWREMVKQKLVSRDNFFFSPFPSGQRKEKEPWAMWPPPPLEQSWEKTFFSLEWESKQKGWAGDATSTWGWTGMYPSQGQAHGLV